MMLNKYVVPKTKRMNIAIAGKMGSGKSYVTEEIMKQFPCFVKTSFASRVKELATELFGMVEKDRGLLIDFATKMRDIDPQVWINCVLRFVDNLRKESKNGLNFVVLDDLRLTNEYETLKSQDWFLVKIDVDEEIRQERLKVLYGDKYESHRAHFNSITENDVVSLSNDNFDFVIQKNSDIGSLVERIKERKSEVTDQYLCDEFKL